MQNPTFAAVRVAVPTGAVAALKAGWQRLPTLDRHLISAGSAVALVLLVALAHTCQLSVQKGERLRAEQRQLAVAAAGVPML